MFFLFANLLERAVERIVAVQAVALFHIFMFPVPLLEVLALALGRRGGARRARGGDHGCPSVFVLVLASRAARRRGNRGGRWRSNREVGPTRAGAGGRIGACGHKVEALESSSPTCLRANAHWYAWWRPSEGGLRGLSDAIRPQLAYKSTSNLSIFRGPSRSGALSAVSGSSRSSFGSPGQVHQRSAHG